MLVEQNVQQRHQSFALKYEFTDTWPVDFTHKGIVMWWAFPWWRHEMETFTALLAMCAENSTGSGEFPAQRPVTRSFDVFFDLRLNKRLSKQLWGWWFETPSRSLCRQCNEQWGKNAYRSRYYNQTKSTGWKRRVYGNQWLVTTLDVGEISRFFDKVDYGSDLHVAVDILYQPWSWLNIDDIFQNNRRNPSIYRGIRRSSA